MNENITLSILIENLTDEEADQMHAAIKEIAERYGVEIQQLELIKK